MSVAMVDKPATCQECGQPYETEREKINREYAVIPFLLDALVKGLRVREGQQLTEGLIQERAANLCLGLLGAFEIKRREDGK